MCRDATAHLPEGQYKDIVPSAPAKRAARGRCEITGRSHGAARGLEIVSRAAARGRRADRGRRSRLELPVAKGGTPSSDFGFSSFPKFVRSTGKKSTPQAGSSLARCRRKPRRESGDLGACPQFLTFFGRFRRNHKVILAQKWERVIHFYIKRQLSPSPQHVACTVHILPLPPATASTIHIQP